MCVRNTLVFAYSGENETSLERHKNILTAAIHLCVCVGGGKCGAAELGEQGTGDEFYCVSFHTFDF